MFESRRLLRNLILTLFLGYSFGLEFQSEETTLPKQLTAVLQYGKRLKLSVANVNYPEHRWQFNGSSVSEKCEVENIAGGSSLICADMDWSDEGLYEHQGVTRNGQRETLLAVMVKVVECIKSAKQETELVESVSEEDGKCFCSGITNKCEMADDLFRSKITASLQDGDMVPSRWSDEGESKPLKYYSLPKEMKGNLLKSYGGFLDIEAVDDEVDQDGPDIVLLGNNLTLVYHYKRELEISGELSRKRVQMTEQDWRDVNGSFVSRDMFMTALSNVKEFYVKSGPSGRLDSLQVVLDSADVKDQGLGKVTSVEKCECRDGYMGLSCERCSSGFTRRYAIRPTGVCVSLKEIWDSMKRSLAIHHYQRYRNQYRS